MEDHCGNPKSMRFSCHPIQWVNPCGSWQWRKSAKPRKKKKPFKKYLDTATLFKFFLHLVSTATPSRQITRTAIPLGESPCFFLQGVIDSTTRTSAANVGPRCGGGAVHGAHDAGVARSRQSPGGRRGDLTLPKTNIGHKLINQTPTPNVLPPQK